MRLGLLHGYELTGSGSNEYTRYLSRALAAAGHDVHVLCREPAPERVAHVTAAYAWDAGGGRAELFQRAGSGAPCTVHRLPDASVRPVYLTDKRRPGRVKAFPALTDAELDEYHAVSAAAVRAIVLAEGIELLHANHLVYQPSIAADAGVPFVVYPHGSSIEYVVRQDPRLLARARTALHAAAGIVSGSREVLARILELYPEDADAFAEKSAIVGVGVDTSLFRPVARADRATTIACVRGPFDGRPPAVGADLRARLAAGDRTALAPDDGAYDAAAPDADLADRLARVPWTDGKVLLFVGALTAGKGVQGLVTALPSVLARHPDTHLLVVGSGAYRNVLEALVHALANGDAALFDHLRTEGFGLDRSDLTGPWPDVHGPCPAAPRLADQVHFLGRLPHDVLRHVFPCADLAVFPSVVPEAYPLVLMESLSNGVLPVVSDFSGFADGLETLRAWLPDDLVDTMRLPVDPATRVEGIAARLNALLDAPPTPPETLRAIAVEHFDWSVRALEMTEAYSRFA